METRKQKILRMVERLADDVSYDQVIYHLSVMKDIEIGMEQADRGEVIDHDELFERLEREDADREDPVVRKGGARPGGHPPVRQQGRPADGGRVRKTPPKGRRKA